MQNDIESMEMIFGLCSDILFMCLIIQLNSMRVHWRDFRDLFKKRKKIIGNYSKNENGMWITSEPSENTPNWKYGDHGDGSSSTEMNEKRHETHGTKYFDEE